MAKQTEQSVEVEATAYFKHDGGDVRPGMALVLTTGEARDLIAAGFARPTRVTYTDRALRSSAR